MTISTTTIGASTFGNATYLNWDDRGVSNPYVNVPTGLIPTGANPRVRRLRSLYVSSGGVVQIFFDNGSGSNAADGQDLTQAWEQFAAAIIINAPGLTLVLPGPDASSNPYRDSNERYSANLGSDHGQAAFMAAYDMLSAADKAKTELILADQHIGANFSVDSASAVNGVVGTSIGTITIPRATGTPTPAYSVIGSVPAGLAVVLPTASADGSITGIPSATGSGTIRIRATNEHDTDDWTVAYSFVPPDAVAPAVAIDSIPAGLEGSSVQLSATISGGTRDSLEYSWTVGDGTLNDATSATPTWTRPSVDSDTSVTVSLTVTARGAGTAARSGTSATAQASTTASVTNVVNPNAVKFASSSGDPISGVLHEGITPVTIPRATGTPTPAYATVGSVPTGLVVFLPTASADGSITGIPSATGSGTIRIRATNTPTAGPSAGTEFSTDWTIAYSIALPDAATPVVTIDSIPEGPEGAPTTWNPATTMDKAADDSTRTLRATLTGTPEADTADAVHYDSLEYAWVVSGGTLDDETSATPIWSRPLVNSETSVTISVTVTAVGSGTNARSGTRGEPAQAAATTSVTNVEPRRDRIYRRVVRNSIPLGLTGGTIEELHTPVGWQRTNPGATETHAVWNADRDVQETYDGTFVSATEWGDPEVLTPALSAAPTRLEVPDLPLRSVPSAFPERVDPFMGFLNAMKIYEETLRGQVEEIADSSAVNGVVDIRVGRDEEIAPAEAVADLSMGRAAGRTILVSSDLTSIDAMGIITRDDGSEDGFEDRSGSALIMVPSDGLGLASVETDLAGTDANQISTPAGTRAAVTAAEFRMPHRQVVKRTAANSASLVFESSLFDYESFNDLIFVIRALRPASDGAGLRVEASSDGGATRTISRVASGEWTRGALSLSSSGHGVGAANSNEPGLSGTLRVINAVSKESMFTLRGVYVDSSGSVRAIDQAGMLQRPSVDARINWVRFSASSGSLGSGSVVMTGISEFSRTTSRDTAIATFFETKHSIQRSTFRDTSDEGVRTTSRDTFRSTSSGDLRRSTHHMTTVDPADPVPTLRTTAVDVMKSTAFTRSTATLETRQTTRDTNVFVFYTGTRSTTKTTHYETRYSTRYNQGRSRRTTGHDTSRPTTKDTSVLRTRTSTRSTIADTSVPGVRTTSGTRSTMKTSLRLTEFTPPPGQPTERTTYYTTIVSGSHTTNYTTVYDTTIGIQRTTMFDTTVDLARVTSRPTKIETEFQTDSG